MHKPVIGIPDARHNAGKFTEVYGSTEHYIESIHRTGGIPVQLPMVPGADAESLQRMVSLCDGFLLPGGGDFNPEWFGETLLPCLSPDPAAMDYESQKTALEFIRIAAASGKPILGICLGMQAINIALGGSLYQDIAALLPGSLHHPCETHTLSDRWRCTHSVSIRKSSLLHRIVGRDEIPVNSFHHQAVHKIAPEYSVTAAAPDGVAEAIEHASLPILGVQWHPENLAHAEDPNALALFRWLTDTAANRK